MYHFFSEPGGGGSTRGPSPELLPVAEPEPPFDAFVSDCSTGGVASAASVSLGSVDALSINQLRDVRPNEVEQTENEGRDDGHDDDDHRCRADFLGGWPSDLLELRRHLVCEVVVLIVAVHHDADD